MSKYGVFSGPNTGNYGPEKSPYLDNFHVVDKTEATLVGVIIDTRMSRQQELEVVLRKDFQRSDMMLVKLVLIVSEQQKS